MNLSPLQRKLLIGYLIFVVIACVYVPWQRVHRDNPALKLSMGYSLVWKVPSHGSAIDYGKVGLELLAVSAVFGIAYLVIKSK